MLQLPAKDAGRAKPFIGIAPALHLTLVTHPARRLLGNGEVVPPGHGVGAVQAQHPLGGGWGLLLQRDRLICPARRQIDLCDVVPCVQRVGVVRAQQRQRA